jgi:hypothetical protein
MNTKFRTHTGEIIQGERLQAALDAVADDWIDLACRIREDDEYASHVSEEEKDQVLKDNLKLAEEVRRGEINSFTTWQRVNEKITGESPALLPGSCMRVKANITRKENG